MRKTATIIALTGAIMLGGAQTAQAHERYTGHGDHTRGHRSYMIQFVDEKTVDGSHWHKIRKKTNPTWFGWYRNTAWTKWIKVS